MKYAIKVTEGHIRAGKTRDCADCPIALALSAALNLECRVDHYAWFAIEPGLSVSKTTAHWLPPIARQFVDDFDAGHYVGPFEFEVEWEPQLGTK